MIVSVPVKPLPLESVAVPAVSLVQVMSGPSIVQYPTSPSEFAGIFKLTFEVTAARAISTTPSGARIARMVVSTRIFAIFGFIDLHCYRKELINSNVKG